MASDDFAEALLQGEDVERSAKVEGHWYVVNRAARLLLVQEPQPLLGEGGGKDKGSSYHEGNPPMMSV